MAETTDPRAIGASERAALKRLALEGSLDGERKVSCGDLGDRLDVSTQTASRRLQALDRAGLLERETVSDGQWIAITDAGERVLRHEHEQYRRVFEAESEVTLSGTITSGMGEGRHYITLPGYMAQFEEELGYSPFPGTLNVDLDEESTRARTALEGIEPIEIEGWEDEERTYGPAFCYPATVETSEEEYASAHIIAPERTHHDPDHVEVIAPDRLRDVFGIEDGDALAVTVGPDSV